ncbi:MAG TPA: DUF58 domain-containing protein [Tepidisphaeraceae bacterium]|jgi:uncharacterized protein (DUF58 family)|nr:DUF58 domain-containing protein [Tepidisphaeraceae bacterium]
MAESNPYLKPEILARITKLGLRAQRVVEGTISGLHRSPLHGVSVEFADYREYSPGDDLKRLDWRAYARTNRHFIKQYEEESNLRATLLVDASASMNYGRGAMNKFNYAATIAASIAHLCVRQRDAVGMAVFDNAERVWLRPVATQSQLAKITDLLERTRPNRTTELGQVMAQVSEQIRSRGMVIVISDLLCDLDSFYKSLGRLQYGGHEVLVFHVLDREEIELPFNDSVLFKDIEGDEQLFAEPWAFRKAYQKAMETFIEEVAQRCRFCGIDHVLLKTDDDLSLSLSHYLHQRQRMDHGKRGGKIANFGG